MQYWRYSIPVHSTSPAGVKWPEWVAVRELSFGGRQLTSSEGFPMTVPTVPTVISINRVSSPITNATSVDYAVTFSEAITGVDLNDFVLTTGSTAAGNIASLSGSGSVYTVTVSTVSGDGTLRLDLNSSGTGIVSTSTASPIASGFIGNAYTIDHTSPTISSVLVPANATYATNQSLDFTVNFTEAVSADVSGGTPRIAIALNTGGTVYANYLSGSGTSGLTFRYTVVAGNADNDGITVGTLDLNGATIRDSAGNNGVLTLNSVGALNGVLVAGAVPPVFDSAVVTGNSLVMSYVEATTLDASNTPTSGAFAVTVGGLSVAVTGVVVNAAAKTATLTLATAARAGQAVTVAYTDPTAGDDTNALQNAAGTDAVSLAATAVTNNTALVVASVAVPASASYTVGDALSFTVNFSEAVTANVGGGTPRLAITLDTGGTVYANYVSGSGSNALVFRYTVAAGNADADGVAVASTLDLNGATIQAVTGANAVLTLNSVGSTSGVLVVAPPVAPVFSAAAVTGNSLVIRYVEATTLDAVNKPATSAFEVKVGGIVDTVTAVTIDAAAKTATLTLATAVAAGQSVTVAYTDPTVGNDLNALQNAAGTDAVSLSATVATNNTVAPVVVAPAVGVTLTAPANGGVLQGTAQADTFIGSGSKDIFYPAGGTDSVDGGSGIDTVVLPGTRAQYGISHQADGTFTVRSLTDANSVVTMKNVERLTFDNQTVALDITPTTGRVAELYHLALGRNPEEGGLVFYVGAGSQGLSTTQLAMNFVSSLEFAKTHGALDNTSFVTQLYQSAFNRAPDATGFAYFMNQLAANPGATGQAAVIANFIDSPEMAIKLAGVVDQGVALLAV
ncbi:SwmB domain-containing protein [Pseudomonas sp. G.S.17]|uniref:SwmB domain-containing protein n=1 Tax=Pseudomonas sp. G.S.17 TaxID=3137451 RepID=UPI00311CDCDD